MTTTEEREMTEQTAIDHDFPWAIIDGEVGGVCDRFATEDVATDALPDYPAGSYVLDLTIGG